MMSSDGFEALVRRCISQEDLSRLEAVSEEIMDLLRGTVSLEQALVVLRELYETAEETYYEFERRRKN